MDQQQTLALLLQPALIRLIDQLRLQLTGSNWQWSYQTHEIWPENVPQFARDRYGQLQAQLDTVKDTEAEVLDAELATMVMPVPVYFLDLIQGDRQLRINMWELCYQICLQEYSPVLASASLDSPALALYSLDPTLLESDETIDWSKLDQKAADVVSQMLEGLN